MFVIFLGYSNLLPHICALTIRWTNGEAAQVPWQGYAILSFSHNLVKQYFPPHSVSGKTVNIKVRFSEQRAGFTRVQASKMCIFFFLKCTITYVQALRHTDCSSKNNHKDIKQAVLFFPGIKHSSWCHFFFFSLHRSSGDLYMTSDNSTGLNVPKLLSGFTIFRAVMINPLLVELRESGKNVNLNLAKAWDAIGRESRRGRFNWVGFFFLFSN